MLQVIKSTNGLGVRPSVAITRTLSILWIQRSGLSYVTKPQKPVKVSNEKRTKAPTLPTEEELIAAYKPFRLTPETKKTLENLSCLAKDNANNQNIKAARFPNTAICLDALQKREKLFEPVENDFNIQETIISLLKTQNTRQISLMTLIQLLKDNRQFKENATLQSLISNPASFHQWFLGSTQNGIFSVSEMNADSTAKDTATVDLEKTTVSWTGHSLNNKQKNGILYQLDKHSKYVNYL
jgi:hypothetical protein